MGAMSSTAQSRARRRREAHALAEYQGGVLSHRQLYAAGWSRWQVDAEVAAGRWARHVRGVVATHTGPLSREALWWTAVLGVGRTVALAGVSALQASGLTGIRAEMIDVVVPSSSHPRRVPGVRARETTLLRDDDVAAVGIPRVRPAVAVVQAARWARSDRQAALMVVAPVQQRIVQAAEIADVLARSRRQPRRALLTSVVADVADGAHALGELDFARLCRRRGLPEPTRQRVVITAGGRRYLDVEWEEWALAAEIDGVAHMQVATWLDDSWRENEVVIDGRRVLRFPVLALRLDPGRAMDQAEEALRRCGWRPGLQCRRPLAG
jgi:hypothetical protein